MTVVVSAFYPIASKRPIEFYVPLIHTFLRTMTGELVFFTSAEFSHAQKLSQYERPGLCLVERPFEEMTIFHTYPMTFWQQQLALDPEKEYHSAELGALWANKRFFVQESIELRAGDTVYIWCDVGIFRDTKSVQAGQQFGRRTSVRLLNDRLHIAAVKFHRERERKSTLNSCYSFPHCYLSCAIMAGTPTAWTKYIKAYDQALKRYIVAQVSAMSDQYVTHTALKNDQATFEVYEHVTPLDPWFKLLVLI